ncbi:hypothetical protein HF995_04000 [Sanguibacter hominis ATCC BAA-789]|uniref:Glucosamine/galactosamine-6-phosphate isomerase domain-containing protein n=1 Tax=Sanguibacter hominis ATCC BAA-789 TaxID=1312740 RepID=A0A9X5FDX8_9MICO|nr:6-phosphogluconolactonase [Sanguibacter hominis]NKX92444.1 hypothetical protein [Sanguibacter hominis ATCC BAA-789]
MTFAVDGLTVEVHEDADALGDRAATLFADAIRGVVREHGEARVLIGTGNAQLPFVRALPGKDIPWAAVTIFQVAEYVGLPDGHPAAYGTWIQEHLVTPFQPGIVHRLRGDVTSPLAEAERYEALLREDPIDVVVLGIGENAHIGLNEPHAAWFSDPRWVRVLALAEASRRQEVGEGHFESIDDVPDRAISTTVPGLLAGQKIIVNVPERRKAAAIAATLSAPVGPAVPATALRTHHDAVLLLEPESSTAPSPG